MAFSIERWNENAAGKTGFGRMAVYDGTGNAGTRASPPQTPDQGGDELAVIRGNNFFDHPVVRDAIREIITVQPTRVGGDNSISTTNPERGIGPHDNSGLIVWMKGNDGQAIDILYVHPSGEVRLRGTGIS